MNPSRLRCLIVDDSAPFRTAARGMLESGGITVVGTASTLADAVSQSETTHPDVALVDIDLGGESGFDVADALHALAVEPAVVLISTHNHDEFTDMIDASSAIGFVPKFSLSADRVRSALADAQ
ncbi:LytR/AlgR family response regulator transcription factor [Gordonia sp. NPDC058843]|uniref:LytR/AlgR family response regulator transcription factor n=1 Tax=Gordonia sp. NPDC058843 TaxID=3346648 RepID=UPI00369B1816